MDEASHLVHTFTGHTGRIFSLALCTFPNGTRIAASGSHDRTVRIWNLSDYAHIRTIEYSDFVWRVFIVNGTRHLVVAFVSAEDKILVHELETGEPVLTVHGRLLFAGNAPYFHCPVILISTGEDDLSIINAETGESVLFLKGGFEKVFRAVISLHASLPIIVFTTWNAQNRRSTIQTYRLDDSNSNNAQIAYSDIPQSTSRSNFQLAFEGDSRDGVTSVVISSHLVKPVFCSGHYDSIVRVWDLQTSQLLLSLEGHMDWVVSVAIWRSVEPIVVSGSSDGTIKVWDLQTGGLITTCEGHLRDVWSVTVTHKPVYNYDTTHSHDFQTAINAKESSKRIPNALIVSASSDRTVRVWDINDVIYDIKWNRRKDFCIFLAGHRFVGARKHSEDGHFDHNQAFSIFESLAICREIASFL